VITDGTGGRVKQGLSDPLEPFGRCLSQAGANRGGIAGSVRADLFGFIYLAVSDQFRRR
jgi:hypothetical protein